MRVILRESCLGCPVAEREFRDGHNRIGRAAGCDLQLAAPWISRSHCELVVGADAVTLVDLDSRNGTYVNGQRILSRRVLKSGDLIGLGIRIYEVSMDDDPAVPRKEEEIAPTASTATAC